ncbi:MAG: hypothetical protein JXR70_02095 [Spirochaetales bacterium]|nr:hypothetical protein [Spirochaetales bacterium]
MNKIILKLFAIFMMTMMFGACDDSIVQGRISVRGNEPNTMLTIETSHGVLEITGPLKQQIWQNYQGQEIKIRVKLVREALGPGFPARVEALEIL